MERLKVEKNGQGFKYVDFYAGAHDCIRNRLWINAKVPLTFRETYQCEEIDFPKEGAKVIKTKKGSFVIVPDKFSVVYYAHIKSGYRGESKIEKIVGGEIVVDGRWYHSGQGRLGETHWSIVNGSSKGIEIHGERSGRRVTEREISFKLLPDGTQEEILDSELEGILT